MQVPVTADGRHDLDAMAAAVTDRTKVVMVCTPNNPTGPAVTQTELDEFLAAVPSHVVVVVDEAYVEFVRMDDAVDGLATYRAPPQRRAVPHVLEGLRPGRLPGRLRRRPRAVAAALRAVSLPFGVSAVAQAAAIASLDAEADAARAGRRVGGRARARGRRAARAGLADARAQGNFVWFALGDRTAEFAAAADEAGIMVRPFAGEGARVSSARPRPTTGCSGGRGVHDADRLRRPRGRSISRHRGSTAGSIVVTKYAAPQRDQREAEARRSRPAARRPGRRAASAPSTSRGSARTPGPQVRRGSARRSPRPGSG